MTDYSINLLRQLTEAHSIPGAEDEVRTIFRNELAGKGSFGNDRLGSVYCEAGSGDGPRVLVAGHMDEVGFRVQAITQQGFLTFVAVGGWWGHNLLAQRVEVKTRSGDKIVGVVASKPPHFLTASEREKVQDVSAMFIDIGANDADEVASWGIKIGDSIAPVSSFVATRKEGRYLAKAFDNRVGMGGAIEVGRDLGADFGGSLIVAGTVQEEIGLRGSKTLGNLVKPDVAIVLEGPPADDTPGQDLTISQGILGKGVQIRLHDPSAIMNPFLVDLALEVANREGIPHQTTVRRSGGTDAGGFQFTGSGVPCIVLGVPARYIHSHNGIIDIADYQAMIDLTKALATAISHREFEAGTFP